MVFFRESNVYVFFFSDHCTYQLLFKSRNKGIGSDCQRIVGSFSAFKSSSINKTFEIKCDHITVFYCSVIYIQCSGVAFLFFLQFCCNFFFCYFCSGYFYFHTFVFAQSYFRFYSYFSCEDKRFSFFNLYNIDFRLRNDFQTAFFCCLRIFCLDQCICCIFEEDTCSIHFFNHNTRSFSFTESRYVNSVFVFVIRSVHCFFKIFCRSFDGKLCHVFFQFFYLYAHFK